MEASLPRVLWFSVGGFWGEHPAVAECLDQDVKAAVLEAVQRGLKSLQLLRLRDGGPGGHLLARWGGPKVPLAPGGLDHPEKDLYAETADKTGDSRQDLLLLTRR